MAELSLPAHYGRTVVVDHCGTCGGLWFDSLESQQLTAGATLELLDRMATADAHGTVREAPRCARCGERLRETTDVQRGTRFTYHACPGRHGRFITSYQFLREKHLVRELSPQERLELRASLRQINCVNCGGPVALAGAPACAHCGTPVSTVDPRQLRRELEALRERDARAGVVDPTLPIRLAHERARAERAWAAEGGASTWLQDLLRSDSHQGPLAAALRMLTRQLG